MKVSTWRTPKGELRIAFPDAQSREDYDGILSAVEQQLEGRILQRIDGPDALVALIEVKGVRAWLICDDDLDIFLKGDPELSEDSLREIADQIAITL